MTTDYQAPISAHDLAEARALLETLPDSEAKRTLERLIESWEQLFLQVQLRMF